MTPQRPEDIPLLYPDPVIEAFLASIDRTLLRGQLMRTATERVQSLHAMDEFIEECQRNHRTEMARLRGEG